MALYEITNGSSATQVGKQTNRNPQTIMEWVHRYNQEGITALKYQRSVLVPLEERKSLFMVSISITKLLPEFSLMRRQRKSIPSMF